MLLGGKPLENEGLLINLCSDMATLDVDIRMLGGKWVFLFTSKQKIWARLFKTNNVVS